MFLYPVSIFKSLSDIYRHFLISSKYTLVIFRPYFKNKLIKINIAFFVQCCSEFHEIFLFYVFYMLTAVFIYLIGIFAMKFLNIFRHCKQIEKFLHCYYLRKITYTFSNLFYTNFTAILKYLLNFFKLCCSIKKVKIILLL